MDQSEWLPHRWYPDDVATYLQCTVKPLQWVGLIILYLFYCHLLWFGLLRISVEFFYVLSDMMSLACIGIRECIWCKLQLNGCQVMYLHDCDITQISRIIQFNPLYDNKHWLTDWLFVTLVLHHMLIMIWLPNIISFHNYETCPI